MTPGARCAAAIEVLDEIGAGAAAEQALTNWGRRSRFAGSGDRAAVRDLVFDVLRRWRSSAALGGGDSGRVRVLGLLRATGRDPDALFDGVGHAPAPLTAAERGHLSTPVSSGRAIVLDCPDWLLPRFDASLGQDADGVLASLRDRAPVTVRVNTARGDPGAAAAALAAEGIATTPVPGVATALEVTGNARRLQRAAAYRDGRVEVQDAASQAVVALMPSARRVLDYCAGGGGKALALAARGAETVVAHDANRSRMRDIPARASRAGVDIALSDRAGVAAAAPFDLVVADVPCSGSGAWRRAPGEKWRLTPGRLAELTSIQADILMETKGLVAPVGVLAYVTCSVLREENDAQVARFLSACPGWRCIARHRFLPPAPGDGFFVALLGRRRGA